MLPNYLDILKENEHRILIVHYSCSDITQVPIKISCIGVRDEFHNETLSLFSLRTFSEEELLENFWQTIAENSEKYFVGWNIKNPEFGFRVLKERYEEISGKKAPTIKTNNIIDLDEVIKQHYDLKRQKLDLKRVAEINGYQTLNFRSGKEEIMMFQDCDFRGLELSVGRKVKIIGDILNDLIRGKLKWTLAEEGTFWSSRKIIGVCAYVVACIIADWFLFSTVTPLQLSSVIALAGVELAALVGLPKLLEWLKR